MRFYNNKKYNTIAIYVLIVIAISMLMVIAIFRFSSILKVLDVIADIAAPVTWGLAIAFVLNPIVKLIYKLFYSKIFKGKDLKKTSKIIAIVISEIILILFIAGLLWTLIPALITSITEIFNNITPMTEKVQKFFQSALSSYPSAYDFIADKLSEINTNANDMLAKLQPMLNNVLSGAWGFFGVLKDFALGFFVSIYLLFSKESLIAQLKKIMLALFKKKSCNRIFNFSSKCNYIFSGFLTGKVLDSLIIGLICIPFLFILKMPYAPLLAVIIGVTNIIPFFGPFIGAIPTSLLVLIIDPKKVIPFLIFVILLQQFDGNILGPKILGDSTGLPPIWVMISLFIGGGLFGFVGMILAVPTFAVIYDLFKESVEKKLKAKKLPTSTSYYKDNIEHLYQSPQRARPLTPEELELIEIPPIEEVNEAKKS